MVIFLLKNRFVSHCDYCLGVLKSFPSAGHLFSLQRKGKQWMPRPSWTGHSPCPYKLDFCPKFPINQQQEGPDFSILLISVVWEAHKCRGSVLCSYCLLLLLLPSPKSKSSSGQSFLKHWRPLCLSFRRASVPGIHIGRLWHRPGLMLWTTSTKQRKWQEALNSQNLPPVTHFYLLSLSKQTVTPSSIGTKYFTWEGRGRVFIIETTTGPAFPFSLSVWTSQKWWT